MKNNFTNQVLRSAVTLTLKVLALTLLATHLSFGQNQPVLQITSPADGSIASPGETISLAVASPAGVSFAQVFLIGQRPIGFSSIVSSVPAQFSLSIPINIAPGRYSVIAWGIAAQGNQLQSQPIAVDVERPDSPTQIAAEPRTIMFESQGEQLPVRLWGTFADRSYLDLTASSKVVYASSNPSVASVDAAGMVTALATGSAFITATYGQGSPIIQVNIPVVVPPPMLTPSPPSLVFAGQPVGTSSSFQALSLTNTSNAALTILEIGTTGDFSESDDCGQSTPLNVGATCAVNVTFTPTAVGSRQGSLIIANKFNVVPIAIPLAGTGTDITPPVTVAARSPLPNQAGWNNSNVTVTLNSTDSEPGGAGVNEITYTATGAQAIASTTASGASTSFIVNTQGITTITFFGTDNAGNIETAKTITIKLDKTRPTVACSTSPNVLWPPNNNLVPINASVSVTDPLSGPAGFTLVSVTSSEPDSGQGDIQGFATGTASTSGQLRAQRLGSGTGRVYTFTYRGADRAGNSASCTTTVTVPHDQGN